MKKVPDTFPPAPEKVPDTSRSLWSDAWLTLRHNRAAITAAIALGILVLLVVAGPALSGYRYDKPDWDALPTMPTIPTGPETWA